MKNIWLYALGGIGLLFLIERSAKAGRAPQEVRIQMPQDNGKLVKLFIGDRVDMQLPIDVDKKFPNVSHWKTATAGVSATVGDSTINEDTGLTVSPIETGTTQVAVQGVDVNGLPVIGALYTFTILTS